MKNLFATALLLILISSAHAQGEFNRWYFGYGCGMNFNNTPPSIISPNPMSTDDNTATISDASGNLLFYANGLAAYNRTNVVMPNGSGLTGNSTGGQTATIVQKPGSNNQYYLFAVDAMGGSNGIKYSIVDMTLNGGLGDIVSGQKNITLLASATERIVPIRHSNGVDIWILIHEWNSNAFRAYLLTASGISATPVVTSIGNVNSGGYLAGYNAMGQITVNRANNKVAMATYSDGNIEIYDFNNSTGVLSNRVALSYYRAWGLEFSPSGQYLYATGWYQSNIYQYDLSTYTSAAVSASQVNLGACNGEGYLQMGPDGKIYIAKYGTSYIGVINSPDNAGAACNFVDHGFSTGGPQSSAGLVDKILVNQVCALSVKLGNDTLICGSSSFTLTDTNSNATHLWNTGATTASINVTTSGSYWVQTTQGTCVGRDTINVTFASAPQHFSIGSDTSYCGSFSRVLSTGVANTLWSTGVTAPQITVSTPGTYWAQESSVCGAIRDSIFISQNPMPTVSLGNDTALCQGNNLILNAGNTGASYLWEDNSTAQTLTVTSSGTYWVKVTENGCSKRDSILVSYVSPLPAFSIGNDTSYCGSFSRVLTTGNANTLWSTGVTASQITVASPGLYWAQNSNSCGTVRAAIIISENPLPSVSLGNDTSLCQGNNVILNAGNSGASYLWEDNTTAQTLTVNSAGTYWVDVTVNGCTKRDSIVVSYVSPLPVFSIGNDTAYCGSFSRVLFTGVANTLWSTGVTASQITVSTAGTYWGQESNVCGAVRDSVVLSQNPLPNVSLGNDTTLCQGNNLILNAGNTGASYLWDDNTTAQTLTVSSAGTYWVNATLNGCTQRDSILVSYVSPLSSFSIGNDTTLCSNVSLTLSTGSTLALWSTNVTDSQITVTASGTYWAEETNACGSVRDSILISQKPLPVVDLGNDTAVCQGLDLTLNAGNAGAAYLWNDNTTAQTSTVTPPGIYWVDVTVNGCTKRDSITGSVLSAPSAFSLGNDTTICEDSSIVLNAFQPNVHYSWSNGDTSSFITVNQSGQYQVIDSNQCGSYSASVNITTKKCTCKVAIPTAFSPNGDGKNETFGLLTQCPLENYELNIYNRWGQKIFTSTSLQDKWDGDYKNTQQPLGVYVYFVHYKDPYTDKTISQAGNVTLLR
jgi:gliding motility-associated-like protein